MSPELHHLTSTDPDAIPVDGRTASYDYELPDALIAQTPIEPRDASRLLVLPRHGGPVSHRAMRDLPDYLGAGDLLVFNDTKVIPARLYGQKESGGLIEFLLLRPLGGDRWLTLVRPGKRLRPGHRVRFGAQGDLEAEILDVTPTGERIVQLRYEGDFWQVLDRIGEMPLPPYIETKLAKEDSDRYQTVYASREGSVAAPTAGLHFTPALLAALEAKGVRTAFLTLHVGVGTFRPVSEDCIDDHPMHTEVYEVDEATAALLRSYHRQPGKRIVAVGTTVTRTLESVMAAHGQLQACTGETNLFIKPGYEFQAIDGLLTNFHLPKSTLLMLVSALAGRERVMAAYREAVQERYRFFSFGDGCLILP